MKISLRSVMFFLLVICFGMLTNPLSVKASEEIGVNTNYAEYNIVIDRNKDDIVYVQDLMGGEGAQELQKNSWRTVYSTTHKILIGISGMITLTFVLLLLTHALQLGLTSMNPQERAKTLKDLLWTSAGLGLFAASTVIMLVAFRTFHN